MSITRTIRIRGEAADPLRILDVGLATGNFAQMVRVSNQHSNQSSSASILGSGGHSAG